MHYILSKGGELTLFGILVLILGYLGYHIPQYTELGERIRQLEQQPGPALYKAGHSLEKILDTLQVLPLVQNKAGISKNKFWLDMARRASENASHFVKLLPPDVASKIGLIPDILGYLKNQIHLVEEYKPLRKQLSLHRKIGLGSGVLMAYVIMIGVFLAVKRRRVL